MHPAARALMPPPAVNPYGRLDPLTGEYVIARPDTPTPWLNYLGQGRFGGIVSNTGGGFSFDRDPRGRRVTRYRYNAVPADQPGRYVYIRDQETAEFWSATWQPVRGPLDAYECRHGPGYTRIVTTWRGIETELLYFVPIETADDVCPCELWVLRVRNAGSVPRRLRTFSYAELSLPDAVADQQNLDWAQQIVSSRLVEGAILASTRFSPTTTFLASTTEACGWTGDREAFVGRGRGLGDPIVVESGEPTDESSARGNSIGSLAHDLVLAPAEERTLVYLLGITDRPETIAATVGRFAADGAIELAVAALREDWAQYFAHFGIETPDPEMDAMLNTWNQVQCRTTMRWARFVSGYETGLGRGLGTRDSAQDLLGTVHAAPADARSTLLRLWSLQFADGHCWHQYYPLTGEGAPGIAAEQPDFPQWFSDDHLWLVIATCAYLRETGDLGLLEKAVPFVEAGPEPVRDHVERAVAFTLEHRGPHGLPRAGYADWDDTLNVDHGSGRAESVWTAMQFCRAMLDLAELAEHLGSDGEAARFRELHATMAAAVNDAGWDGAWYRRAFDDGGRPIGTAGETHHAINLIPQAWAVIGEAAGPARAGVALRSALDRLETPFGVVLLDPPYDGADPRVVGTATYPPGAKENGGIFCHAHAWAIVAAAALGWADDALRLYRDILPLARTDADRYGAEPYVYSQNVCGPSHPAFGLARNAWLTGTAAWTFVAATQWILGLRPTYCGLRVHPALPSTWPAFRARRVFRDVAYDIDVRRGGRETRSVGLCVDGRWIDGDVIPLPAPGITEVRVDVVVG